ncbi:hypothetical protein [Gemmata sp. SH-PL17]|uniref:hypothetical protein n=1 Tax=Gemmata sp. SH-PL17 TaxID=1630693 RepID=UPI0012F879DA|nr:hypothetical protein [Gemmata sp. SH-PL17]
MTGADGAASLRVGRPTPPLTAEQRDEVGRAHRQQPWERPWDVSADGAQIGLRGGWHFVTRQTSALERLVRDYLEPWGARCPGNCDGATATSPGRGSWAATASSAFGTCA